MVKVVSATIKVNQFTISVWSEINSHSVDGEVTPEEVVFNGAGLHIWQCPWPGVGLRAGGG